MKPFFSESDCDGVMGQYSNIASAAYQCHAISLDRANKLLAERGAVVYGNYDKDGHYGFGPICNPQDTHSALLICVEEEIEKPDTAEGLLKDRLELLEAKVVQLEEKIKRLERACENLSVGVSRADMMTRRY